MSSPNSPKQIPNIPKSLWVNHTAPSQTFNNCKFNTHIVNNINGVHFDSLGNQLNRDREEKVISAETHQYQQDMMPLFAETYTIHINVTLSKLDNSNHKNEINFTSPQQNVNNACDHPFSAINSVAQDRTQVEPKDDFRYQKIFIPNFRNKSLKKDSELNIKTEGPLPGHEYDRNHLRKVLMKQICMKYHENKFDLEQKSNDLIRKIRRFWNSSKILYPIPLKRIYKMRIGSRPSYYYMDFVDYSTKIVPVSKH